MTISVNIQRIKRSRARRISAYFSVVDCYCTTDEWDTNNEMSLFLEGPGHEDTAARIAALINEQVIRRDTPLAAEQLVAQYAADEAADEQDRMEEEQAQEDRRQAMNDELGPYVRDRHHDDDEVPF